MTPAEYARLTRPFDPQIMAKAKRLADQYRLIIERDQEGDGYLGCSVEMPTVMGGGDDPVACIRDTLEATALSIAVMLEHGETPPSPSREGKRDQQVNLRLTADEKLALDAAANREGFRSLSDYIRSAALNRSR